MVQRVKRVGVWALGIFLLGHVSGCVLAWLAVARAADTAEVACSADLRAEHDIGTDDPAELARVSVVRVFAQPSPETPPRTAAVVGTLSFAGSKAIAQCNPGDRVVFVLR